MLKSRTSAELSLESLKRDLESSLRRHAGPASGPILAAIVASHRGRTGKTWLARLLAEHFVMAGHQPLIFDTDALDSPLATAQPQAMVVDLDRVPDQITFFDALVAPGPEPRVVDVTHRSFDKFFALVRDSDFIAEAREAGVEPVLFYIPGREHDGFEQGRQLLERFDCTMVVVDNLYLGEPAPFTLRSPGFAVIRAHPLRLTLPRLDTYAARTLDDPNLSITGYLHEPTADIPFAKGVSLREWLSEMLHEIWRVRRAIEAGDAHHWRAEGPKS